jgi:hypothetical protein
VESGTLLADRYRLDQLLGRGRIGEVWRCHDLRLGRDVAVKVLDANPGPEDKRRLRRDALAAGGLRHPASTVVFDIDEHDGRMFIVTELLQGHDLAKLLKARPGGLPASQAVDFAIEIADALAHAHGQGITHGDLKPHNLFVQDDGPLKVCDFGLARDLNALPSFTPRPVSTPAYMAPEQWEGRPAGPGADLYQLGCVLYEMLTGQVPFGGPGLPMLINQHLTQAPVPPRDSNPGVPAVLSTLVVSLLAKAPADRPPSATAVLIALSRIRDPGQPTRPGQAKETSVTRVASVSRGVGSLEVCAVNAVGRLRYCCGTKDGRARRWAAWADVPLPAFGKVMAISAAHAAEGLRVGVVVSGVAYLTEGPGKWLELKGAAPHGLLVRDVAVTSGWAGASGFASVRAYVLDDEGHVWASDGERALAVPVTGHLTAIATAIWGKPDPALLACGEEDIVCGYWWPGDLNMRLRRVPGGGPGPFVDLACASLAANRIEVFVLGADGRIWASTFRNILNDQVNWTALALPPGRVVQIAACPFGSCQGAIIAATDDGGIYQAQYEIEVARTGHAAWTQWSAVPAA